MSFTVITIAGAVVILEKRNKWKTLATRVWFSLRVRLRTLSLATLNFKLISHHSIWHLCSIASLLNWRCIFVSLLEGNRVMILVADISWMIDAAISMSIWHGWWKPIRWRSLAYHTSSRATTWHSSAVYFGHRVMILLKLILLLWLIENLVLMVIGLIVWLRLWFFNSKGWKRCWTLLRLLYFWLIASLKRGMFESIIGGA